MIRFPGVTKLSEFPSQSSAAWHEHGHAKKIVLVKIVWTNWWLATFTVLVPRMHSHEITAKPIPTKMLNTKAKIMTTNKVLQSHYMWQLSTDDTYFLERLHKTQVPCHQDICCNGRLETCLSHDTHKCSERLSQRSSKRDLWCRKQSWTIRWRFLMWRNITKYIYRNTWKRQILSNKPPVSSS